MATEEKKDELIKAQAERIKTLEQLATFNFVFTGALIGTMRGMAMLSDKKEKDTALAESFQKFFEAKITDGTVAYEKVPQEEINAINDMLVKQVFKMKPPDLSNINKKNYR